MTPYISMISAILLLSTSCLAADGGSVDVIGLYGQGFGFWSTVNQITQGNQTPSNVLGLLDSSFDHPQEGIASLQIRVQSPINGDFREFFNQAYFGLGGDALAGGVAVNRILPQIQAYDVYTGHLDFGLTEQPKPHESGFEYRLGSTLGAGNETLVSGSVVDLLDQYSPDNSALFYTGLDLYLGYESHYSEQLSSHYRLSLSPTLFTTDHTDSGAQYAINSDQFNFRWRQENEWTVLLDSAYEPSLAFGLVTILGQQPTPVTFLPRTWDAIHNIEAFPTVGQLIGLGSKISIYGSNFPLGLTLNGGYYGGYFGAGATLHVFMVQVMAGTYGVEQSGGYREEESRIAFLSIGGRIEL
jgi:hypothetical protein